MVMGAVLLKTPELATTRPGWTNELLDKSKSNSGAVTVEKLVPGPRRVGRPRIETSMLLPTPKVGMSHQMRSAFCEQVPADVVMLRKLIPRGNRLVTCTDVAVTGPKFVTRT